MGFQLVTVAAFVLGFGSPEPAFCPSLSAPPSLLCGGAELRLPLLLWAGAQLTRGCPARSWRPGAVEPTERGWEGAVPGLRGARPRRVLQAGLGPAWLCHHSEPPLALGEQPRHLLEPCMMKGKS